MIGIAKPAASLIVQVCADVSQKRSSVQSESTRQRGGAWQRCASEHSPLRQTTLALTLLHVADPTPSRGLEVAVLVIANLVTTALRFVAMRWWVFAPPVRPARPLPRTHPLEETR